MHPDSNLHYREQSKATQSSSGPESPTTVRPFDMDDDDVQDSIPLDNDNAHSGTASKPSNQTMSDEAAPTKPPRPVSQQQKNEQTLKEAFPSIDLAVIRAVLIASGGQIDPAFNALLGTPLTRKASRTICVCVADT